MGSASARLTLTERAAARREVNGPRTRPCMLARTLQELDEPLRSEAIALVADTSIPAADACLELAEPDVGVFISDGVIGRHRRGECVSCRKTGIIPQP